MRIRFVVDRAGVRRWQAEAVATLLATPDRIGSYERVTTPRRAPSLAAALFVETLYNRTDASHPLAPATLADLPPAGTDAPDVVVDLVHAEPPIGGLALSVGEAPVEEGTARAVLAGDNPLLVLRYGAAGGAVILGRWRIGVEVADVLVKAIGPTLGRGVEMLRLALNAIDAGAAPADVRLGSVEGAMAGTAGEPLAFLVRTFAAKLRRHLPGAPTRPRWRVAWRPAVAGDGLPDLDAAPFRLLPDDGRRFYADPFLVRREGRTFLFVEDFPFASGRGVISTVEMGAAGPIGRPEPVLAVDGCHLSYPFMVEDGGELHNPGELERRSVELWRCRRFPGCWERAGVLLADVDVGDATLVRREGRWFMLGSLRPRWGSSWDGLNLWTAPALTGPWEAVGSGPLKVDVATARPAGHLLSIDGRLIRPFQDSAGGYGAGLGFAGIERLDASGYDERVVAAWRARPPLRGLHTYNRGGGFEVIDVFSADTPAEIVP